MAFRLTSLLQLDSELTTTLDLATPSSVVKLAQQMNFAQGAGAGQADRIWHDQRTISASATDSLDLAGSLTDPFGAAITFARIKMLLIRAATGNTNNVNVTRPAANGVPLFLATSDGIPVKPGGVFYWYDPTAGGVAVTAGTGDLIDIVNSGAGTSVTYDVVIVGAAS